MKKRFVLFSIILALVVCWLSIGMSAAMSVSTFNSKLASFKSERYAHNSIYVDDPTNTGGYECFGFANELAIYIFGSYPTSTMGAFSVNSGWTRTYGGSAVDNLAVGDIVRYWYHSIFITNIDGDTITYCQANVPFGTNKVTYGNIISRSTLKSRVSNTLTHEGATTIGWVAHYDNGITPGTTQTVYNIYFSAPGATKNVPSNTSTTSSTYTIPSLAPRGFKYSFLWWEEGYPGDTITLTGDTTLQARTQTPETIGLYPKAGTSVSERFASKGKAQVWFEIRPNSTGGKFAVYSYNNSYNSTHTDISLPEDTVGELYDANGNLLATDDDSGDDRDFKIIYDFKPNTTYYLAANCFNSSVSGSIIVTSRAVYTINYSANGGTGAPSSQEKENGINVTLSSTVPTRSGYTFKGWATSSNGSVVYNAGDTYLANSDVTLYAVWQLNTVSGTCGTNLTWTLHDDGELVISGTGAMYDWESYSSVPWWDYRSYIKKVTIGNGVTRIGDNAFRSCNSLASVIIPDSVTSIGGWAFVFCDNLSSVYIEDIAAWCNIDFSIDYSSPFCYAENLYLNGTLVTELVIPDSVTHIGKYAFYGYSSLESVTIPDSVTSIGNFAFAFCDGLTSVYIEDIAAWCNIEFSNGYSNPLCYAKNLYLNGTLVTDLVIPDNVTSIGIRSFSDCDSLASVTIPDSVTYIDNYAFNLCDNLVKITIYSRNVQFGDIAFGTSTTLEIHGYTGSTAETYASENGHTFVALDAEPEKFDLSGVTMTLGASLSLDFAIDTSKLTGTDNYAEFTIVYADGRPSETVTVPQSEWTKYSGTIYTAKFTGMAAKQMNDGVTAVFYNAKGQVLTNEKSDSIETYAVRMLNGSAASNKKLRTVYVDMLNYGAAAQEQFDYDEANLANRNLTSTHQAWATTSVETVDNRVKGTGYAGSTLTLAGEIQLDLVFKNANVGSDYSDLYALVTYTDHYGNDKEIRIDGADFIEYGSTMCQISITGMAVADFRSVVSCTVYNADGVAVANASDSVESYANRNAASLGAMVDTIVKFGESSYNYFH